MESSSVWYVSTSYFLGKDAHQVNGFVQDFLLLLFNSTLKWMNVGINFYFSLRVLTGLLVVPSKMSFKNWKGRIQRIWKWYLPICISPSLSLKIPLPYFLRGVTTLTKAVWAVQWITLCPPGNFVDPPEFFGGIPHECLTSQNCFIN